MTHHATDLKQPGILMRILSSAWLRMLLFVVIFLILATFVFGGVGGRPGDEGKEQGPEQS